MKTAGEIRQLLSKLLANGPLEHLPKKREDADVILALGAARLDPGRHYNEREINDLLTAWLGRFASPFGMDHVSIRRALVDGGFLRRDPTGSVYTAGEERIRQLLSPETRSIDPGEARMELDRAREAHKKAHQSRKRS